MTPKHTPPEYTMLDHFAGLAMAAAISRSELFQIMDNECLKAHADLYYRMAEAMLHARDRRQPQAPAAVQSARTATRSEETRE